MSAAADAGRRIRAADAGVDPDPDPRTEPGVYTNLDSDTALETAALVVCHNFDSNVSQVVGYDVDAAGAPVLLGRGGRLCPR